MDSTEIKKQFPGTSKVYRFIGNHIDFYQYLHSLNTQITTCIICGTQYFGIRDENYIMQQDTRVQEVV